MPYHNYAGPGTRVSTRLFDGDKPVSGLDAAALVHDVEYELGDQYAADNNMMFNLFKEYPLFPQIAIYTRLSFFVKDLIGYQPKINPRNYDYYKRMVLDKQLLKGYNSTFDQNIRKANLDASLYATDRVV